MRKKRQIYLGVYLMEELRTCPNCSYARGFHFSLKKKDNSIQIVLICPECGSAYAIGLNEDRISEIKPEAVATY